MVKRPRCCKPLNRGYAVDFGRWCGSNGSEDGHGFANFASAASGQTSRHQLPGVLTALGGLRTRPLSPSLCRTPTLPSSDFHSWSCGLSLIRRTAVCGPACTVVWQGRRATRSPMPDAGYCCRMSITGVVSDALTFMIAALVGEMTTKRFSQFALEPVRVHPAGSSPTPDELIA